MNLLVGVTGSVATIKLVPLLEALDKRIPNLTIKIIATERALHFISPEQKSLLPSPLLTDHDEWSMWKGRTDPILHIELRRWADLLLIAPIDANTMAKLAYGICDNLLCSVVRAWEQGKPVALCPAMNTAMWQHPLTETHLQMLHQLGYHIIAPICKRLACGDTGMGAMEEPDQIANWVANLIDCNRTSL